jgi:hypothetical protein
MYTFMHAAIGNIYNHQDWFCSYKAEKPPMDLKMKTGHASAANSP